MKVHLFRLFKSNQKAFWLASMLVLLESAISLCLPWFIGQFSATLLENEFIYSSDFNSWILLVLGLFCFQALLRYFSTSRISFIGVAMLKQLTILVHQKIHQQPLCFFQQHKKGEIAALLTSDIPAVSYFFSNILISLLPTLLLTLGILFFIFSLNMFIAFILSAMLPLFFIFVKFFARKLRPLSQQVIAEQAQLVALTNENLQLVAEIKAFSREDIEQLRFTHQAERIEKLRKQQLHWQAILSPMTQLLISCSLFIVVVLTFLSYQNGQLTLSELITLLLYGLLLAKPMSHLANIYGHIQQALGASKRLENLFLVDDVADGQKVISEKVLQGDIVLDKLTFDYQKNAPKPLLNELTLSFKHQKTSVVVGENGEGKSTLLQLLLRFLQPTSGNISFNGIKINDIPVASLRQNIGIVSQHIHLYNGTIAENIAYGAPNTDIATIEQVAKLSGAATFIDKLKNRYDTQIGEDGVELSGGQRQKIAIARLLLINPQIYLFDEPTSMIDEESRVDFFALLSNLLVNKTIIIVTHDSSLIKAADDVYTLTQGQLTLDNDKEVNTSDVK